MHDMAKKVNDWHIARFPWANSVDAMRKLKAEVYELAYVLESTMPYDEKRQAVADESADVLITLLRIFGAWRIDPTEAFEKKFAEVVKKYEVRP